MKALRTIFCLVLFCLGSKAYGSAMTTLTNFNAAYFLVDADPTAIPTNVVLLSGNITNWQKFSTNIISAINPTDTYVPYRVDAATFGDSWFYRLANGMGINTNLYFGPGTTNWIQRTNAYFQAYCSDPTGYSLMQFRNPSGAFQSAQVGSSPNGAVLSTPGSLLTLGVFGRSLYFDGTIFEASAANTVSLGQQNVPFASGWFQGTVYIEGMDSGSDYSRLAISHGGTNNAIYFDSQSAGIAGAPRDFIFRTNNVPAYHIPGTSWDDSQVPEAMVRVGATAPTLANFNGGPVQTLQFQNARDDTIMATVQMTHRWKQGTDIHPHVHWCETAATGAGTNVVWQLVYAWTNIGCAYPAYTTVSITNSVTGTNWLSQLSEFPPISGTGKLVSSIFVFELKRLANTATADDYNQSVAFLGFDLHHQVDSPGSDSELTKSF